MGNINATAIPLMNNAANVSRSKSPTPPSNGSVLQTSVATSSKSQMNVNTSRPQSKSPIPPISIIASNHSNSQQQQQQQHSQKLQDSGLSTKSPVPMHTNPATSAAPVKLSKQEVEAKKMREKEEARIKAQ